MLSRKKVILLISLCLFVSSCRGSGTTPKEGEPVQEIISSSSANEPQQHSDLSDQETNPNTITAEEEDTEITEEDPDISEIHENIPQDPCRILSSTYNLLNGRLYFETKQKKDGKTVGIPTWYDPGTKEHGPVCRDPLCPHSPSSGCPCITVNASTDFFLTDENTLWQVKTEGFGPCRIERVDLNDNSAHLVYPTSLGEPVFVCADGGILWFTDSGARIGGKTTKALIGIKIGTEETVSEIPLSDSAVPCLVRGGLLYGCESGTLFVTDLAAGNRLAEETVGGLFESWYFDTEDGSFWIAMTDRNEQKGSVYVYEGEAFRRVPLPGEVFCFQLTENEILYSPFDPVTFGGKAVDYSGGKIWRVNRDSPNGEPELLFETAEKEPLCTSLARWTVLEGQLFYSKIGLSGGSFNLADDMPMKRVDLSTGETEEIVFGE